MIWVAGEQYDRLVKELHEEQVAALTRISRTLDELIGQLRVALAVLPSREGPEREQAMASCRDLRARALRYRWYLEVQREAMGIRHHHRLDEFYEIPRL